MKNWVKGLDSLRFILALIVLLSHLENPIAKTLKESSALWAKIGGVVLANLFHGAGAVIAFFIISGFVVHYPVKNTPLNTQKFLIRRWVRIGIPLLVVGAIALYYHSFNAIPVWSLYCELIYYTLYPLLRKLPVSWTRQFQMSFVLYVVVVVFFCQHDLKSLISHSNQGYLGSYWQIGEYWTWLVGLPAWLLGVVLAEKIDAPDTQNTPPQYRSLVFARLIVYVVSVLIHFLKFHFFVSDIIALNLFAFLVYHWLKMEIQYYRQSTPSVFLEYGGKFSYSLYLCHGLIVQVILLSLPLTTPTYLVFVILTLIISFFIYILIESPSHKLAQRLAALSSKTHLN